MYSTIERIFSIESLNLNEKNGSYLLDISIIADSKFKTERYEMTAKLPIDPSMFSISKKFDKSYVDIGFGDLPCVGTMTRQTIEEKEQVMTLDEIEEKLGYKIKLVDKKIIYINSYLN